MLLPPWIHTVIKFQGTQLISLFSPKFCFTLSNQRGRLILMLNCSTSLSGKKLGYLPSVRRTILPVIPLSQNSSFSSASVSAQLLKPWKRWFLDYTQVSDSISPEWRFMPALKVCILSWVSCATSVSHNAIILANFSVTSFPCHLQLLWISLSDKEGYKSTNLSGELYNCIVIS